MSFEQVSAARKGVDEGLSTDSSGHLRRRNRRARQFWLLYLLTGTLVLVGTLVLIAPLWPDGTRKVVAALQLTEGYRPLDLPYAALPFHDQPDIPLVDTGLHDAGGVRMFKWQGKGKPLDHPVAQAQWGLSSLNSFRRTGRQLFLHRAIAQAQRNLDRRVESRGAWWYPYDFTLPRCEGTPIIKAPWHSAMAQGQLLGLFVRLYEATRDEKWRIAAERTFLTLVLPPKDGEPWGTWTDSNGQVWLEEYPRSRGLRGERVLNGHVFAMYGVYDYWRLTKDPRAGALFGSAAATVRHYVPRNFRNPGWASRYSIDCNGPHPKYHQIHIEQMLMLHRMTGDPIFASYADKLREDYPAPKVSGTVRFVGGIHIGYRFSADGEITQQKAMTVPSGTTTTTDQRIRIMGRGIHYRITNGALSGWYVTETIGQRVLLGAAVGHDYSPRLTLALPPGAYTGYVYDEKGAVRKTRHATFHQSTSAMVAATGWLNGELSYQLSSGPLAGYWLPHHSGLTLSGNRASGT